MFIDQLINTETQTILDWNYIKAVKGPSRKGPTPLWYKKVLENICKRNSPNLNHKWEDKQWTKCHPDIYEDITKDRRKLEWCCSLEKNRDRIIWGKIIKKSLDERALTIKHFNSANKGNKDHMTLSPCQGCALNDSEELTPNTCTYKDHRKNLTSPIYLRNKKINENLEINMPCNLYILERDLKEELSRKVIDPNEKGLQLLSVDIENPEVIFFNNIIKNEEYRKEISNAYFDNLFKTSTTESPEFEFFTDGSLKKRSQPEVAMGAAAIQTKGPNPGSTLSAGVKDWPSATRAEATAIVMAILTTPPHSRVQICTDSQSCIDTFHKLSENDPKMTVKRRIKINNWYLWAIFMETIQRRNINIIFKKVKAHANNNLNNKADYLAKLAAHLEPIEWNITSIYGINTIPTWENITCEINIRDLLKDLNKNITTIKWSKQQRIQKLLKDQIEEQTEFEWHLLWNNIRVHGFNTSEIDNRKRSFWIKLLHNELPTLDRLAIRNPKLYNNFKMCCMCHKAVETREHLFVCPKLSDLTTEAWQVSRDKALKKLLKTQKKEKNNHEKDSNQELTRRIARIGKMLDGFEKETFGSCKKLMLFTLGLVKKKDISALGNSLTNKRGARKRAEQIMVYFSTKFRENFRKMVWGYRCEIINSTDKTRGLTKKIKKQKADRSEKIQVPKKKRHRGREKEILDETTSYIDNVNINSVIEKVKKIVHNRIETGIKWLGI